MAGYGLERRPLFGLRLAVAAAVECLWAGVWTYQWILAKAPLWEPGGIVICKYLGRGRRRQQHHVALPVAVAVVLRNVIPVAEHQHKAQCHDIKHQIAALGDVGRERELREIERLGGIYDCQSACSGTSATCWPAPHPAPRTASSARSRKCPPAARSPSTSGG